MRRSPAGEGKTIASKVASFTLGPDDSRLYTNGFTVWHLAPGSTSPRVVHRGRVIQALAVV